MIGDLGPLPKTLSLSPDVNDPAFRAVTFDQVRDAYATQVRGLLEGGVDTLMIETIFDTLNAKAAIVAIEDVFDEVGRRVPVMISVTFADKSGRNLSGQTLGAFWNAIAHAKPLSVGLNCGLGAVEVRPYVEELSGIADTFTSVHPNAGLPNVLGEYDQTAEIMSGLLREFAESGFVNLVGGCCGTNAEHIRQIVAAVEGVAPRRVPVFTERRSRYSGLETFTFSPEIPFVMVGERTNITGSKKFERVIKAGDLDGAAAIALDQVRGGANIIDVNMDEGMIDSEAVMTRFLNQIAADDEISRLPVMVDSSKWSVIEAGLKCLQGKSIVNSISLKEGEADFLAKARHARRYGAGVVVMAFDEVGQAETVERKVEICTRAYRLLTEQVGIPPEDIIFDPNILAIATGIEEHARFAINYIEATRIIKATLPGVKISRRRVEPVVLVPRQRRGARGDPLRVPVPRGARGHGHGHRERGPARGLRGHPQGPARARRGHPVRPAARRDRAHGRVRRAREGRRQEARGRPVVARRRRRAAPLARARARAHGLHRAGRRGGAGEAAAPARRDRRSADGRHEDRRRPVRRREDVPAAGGEERARDEARGRLPRAVHGEGQVGRVARPARSWSRP